MKALVGSDLKVLKPLFLPRLLTHSGSRLPRIIPVKFGQNPMNGYRVFRRQSSKDVDRCQTKHGRIILRKWGST